MPRPDRKPGVQRVVVSAWVVQATLRDRPDTETAFFRARHTADTLMKQGLEVLSMPREERRGCLTAGDAELSVDGVAMLPMLIVPWDEVVALELVHATLAVVAGTVASIDVSRPRSASNARRRTSKIIRPCPRCETDVADLRAHLRSCRGRKGD